MLTASPDSVRKRCEIIASSFSGSGIHATVRKSDATVGAGAFPARSIPSYAVAIAGDAQSIEKRLRAHATPIIARVENDTVILDMRSVLPSQDEQLLDCIRAALG
jgi:L-seryl-tRNA(Ser) seleniumtransferase